jgi:hypothetical protein
MFVVRMFLLAVILLVPGSIAAQAAVPELINFQGQLRDSAGNLVPDGPVQVRFIVWDDSTATDPTNRIWDSGPLTLTVSGGLISVALGTPPMPAMTPIQFQTSVRFLGITVGSDAEMNPRTRITSVPYAFRAQTAEYAVAASVAQAATTAGTAVWADSTSWADSARLADSSVFAQHADSAGFAIWADSATWAASYDTVHQPGVAAEFGWEVPLTSKGEAYVIDTVRITIPAAGYIVLIGCGYILYGLCDTVKAMGDDPSPLVRVYVGDSSSYNMTALGSTIMTDYISFSLTHVLYKDSGGSYLLLMCGQQFLCSDPVKAMVVKNPLLTAMYFPTWYGNVKTSALPPKPSPSEIKPEPGLPEGWAPK